MSTWVVIDLYLELNRSFLTFAFCVFYEYGTELILEFDGICMVDLRSIVSKILLFCFTGGYKFAVNGFLVTLGFVLFFGGKG